MNQTSNLTIQVRSFSYKRGIPYDASGHGGGYVFDCRGILNPGKYERYMMLNGKDQEVVDFFKKNTNVDDFLHHVYELVAMHVQTYLDRGLDHLMVAFGCTGGQHRSVYCAEEVARRLKNDYNIRVDLEHLDLPG